MTTRSEVKITIAKLIEIAYSRNKGVTTKFLRKKGNFKLTIDQNGKVMMHGGAGPLTFNGGAALEGLGVKIKMASINFTKGDGDNINYKGTFSFAGSFNIEELIMSCSGLLCRAARLLKGRRQAYDAELQRIMGR